MEIIRESGFRVAIFKVGEILQITVIEEHSDNPFIDHTLQFTPNGNNVVEIIKNKIDKGEFPELLEKEKKQALQYIVEPIRRGSWARTAHLVTVK